MASIHREISIGVPPEQVVGSSGVVKFEMRPDGLPVLVKIPEVEFVDDGPQRGAGDRTREAALFFGGRLGWK